MRGLAGDGAVLAWIGSAGDVFRGALEDFPVPVTLPCRERFDCGMEGVR